MTATDRRIINEVERNSEQIVHTLQDLIKFRSIVPIDSKSPDPGEMQCQQYLRDRLVDLGFEVDLWEPDGEELYERYKGRPGAQPGRVFAGRPILAGRLHGSGGGRSLMLSGHVDVVPPGDLSAWAYDPFVGTVIDGRVFGRGAVDMKGGVACMLSAVQILRELAVPLRGDVVFATVLDEEIGGMGTLALVDRGWRADAGILTEATDLAIVPVVRGILWGRITIEGVSGHAEIARRHWDQGGAVDAIELLRFILGGFDILNARWSTHPNKRHPLLDLPNQLVVTQITAGEHPSSFAGRAEITVDIQYLPHERDEFGLGSHVKQEVEEYLARCAAVDPWLIEHPPKIEWILDADCAEVSTNHPIVGLLEDALNSAGHVPRIKGMGFHTDMGVLTELGRTPTVNFGGGDPTQAHQPNESISIDELIEATKVLALATAHWCA